VVLRRTRLIRTIDLRCALSAPISVRRRPALRPS
jgi:hypothetical protein